MTDFVSSKATSDQRIASSNDIRREDSAMATRAAKSPKGSTPAKRPEIIIVNPFGPIYPEQWVLYVGVFCLFLSLSLPGFHVLLIPSMMAVAAGVVFMRTLDRPRHDEENQDR